MSRGRGGEITAIANAPAAIPRRAKKGAVAGARPAGERRAIIERFHAACGERVGERPEDHAMDHVNAYMVIVKE